MTRLHYPREFRQQSPAVLMEKPKGAITKIRLGSISLPLINPKMQPDNQKGPIHRAARVRSGFRQWANQRSTPCSPASSPRRYSEYKTRP